MFEGKVLTLVGLCKIELPSVDIKLCDGGILHWGADKFTSNDPLFGTISAFGAVQENISDEAPSSRITLMPPSTTAAADLFQTDAQGSPINFWLAEVTPATGAVVGTPELLFTGMVDTVTVNITKTERTIDIEFMSEAERLWMIREGNAVSDRFHQLAWPGELGFVHCTGTQVAVPWGVPTPGRFSGVPFFGDIINFAHRSQG